MNKRFGWLAVILGAVLIAGCSGVPKRDPEYAPAPPVVPPPAPQGNGAIYQEGYANAWFENVRARRIGDILTVKLVEKTDATKTADTSVAKDSSTSITNPTILGTTPEFNLPSGIGLPLATTKNLNLSADLQSSHSFDGKGDSAQSNELTGDITVTVYEVLPNGYLRVRGEKRIGINQGNEYIKVSGIVRPADIDSTNTVLSTRLADPTLVYVGDGPVADSNVMGWLAKFFISALMPF
jgi:flagellar L-ring protein precursor FlgH